MPINVLEDLNRIFGDYQSPNKEDSWQTVKKALTVDSVIKGKVVARFQFGVFLDAGLGFPVLLEIINMTDMSPEKYRNQYCNDMCYCIGEEIHGTNVTFGDRNRQIGIVQLNADQ